MNFQTSVRFIQFIGLINLHNLTKCTSIHLKVIILLKYQKASGSRMSAKRMKLKSPKCSFLRGSTVLLNESKTNDGPCSSKVYVYFRYTSSTVVRRVDTVGHYVAHNTPSGMCLTCAQLVPFSFLFSLTIPGIISEIYPSSLHNNLASFICDILVRLRTDYKLTRSLTLI